MLSKTPFDSVPGLEHPGTQLALSILFDVIGLATYLVPVIGEFGDVLWAPIQAGYILGMLGPNRMGLALAAFGFAEEILPLTDFIPSCSIAWFFMYVQKHVRR